MLFLLLTLLRQRYGAEHLERILLIALGGFYSSEPSFSIIGNSFHEAPCHLKVADRKFFAQCYIFLG